MIPESPKWCITPQQCAGNCGGPTSETALSFLGLWLQPACVGWGVLLKDTQSLQVISQAYWLLIPELSVVITVLAFNFQAMVRVMLPSRMGKPDLKDPNRVEDLSIMCNLREPIVPAVG